MHSVTFLLAMRYIQSASHETAISTMIKVCFLGISIGTFSLALIVAIMNGFEQSTYRTLQGMHADITINAPHDAINFEKLAPVLRDEFPEIAAYSPYDTQQVMIQNDATETIEPIILKGVIPSLERTTSLIEKTIIATTAHQKALLPDLLSNNTIVIGYRLAQTLQVECGDTVLLLFPTDYQSNNHRMTFDSHPAIIGALVKTGIEEFDSTMTLCSYDFLLTLFPDADVSSVALTLHNQQQEKEIIGRLQKRFPLFDTYSWKELYPAIVSALQLEKYAMILILSLITLVSSIGMIALIFMIVLHKQRDIAILQTMGTPVNIINNIFILIGMGISLTACFFGLLAAFFVEFFLYYYPCIPLPDAYYVTHLPIAFELYPLIIIFCAVMMSSYGISWLAIRFVAIKKNVTLLRTS